jgi:integrase
VADDHDTANGDTIMDYWQALERAKALARVNPGRDSNSPLLTCEVVADYATDLALRDGMKGNATQLQGHLEDSPLWRKAVVLVSEREFRDWRAGLIRHKGLKPASADRCARSFKAALNLASRSDVRVASNAKAWGNGLRRLPETESARNVILSDVDVSRIVRAAYDVSLAYGILIEALALTGQRQSQLFRLTVGDLQDQDRTAPRLMVPASRKGRKKGVERKPVPISPRLASLLRQQATGRALHEPLLTKPSLEIGRTFRKITKRLGITAAAVPYSLRHSSIVRMLLKGVPVRVCASHHDTSVTMIEKFYSAYILNPVDAMTRSTLPDFGAAPDAAGNVVAIR